MKNFEEYMRKETCSLDEDRKGQGFELLIRKLIEGDPKILEGERKGKLIEIGDVVTSASVKMETPVSPQ